MWYIIVFYITFDGFIKEEKCTTGPVVCYSSESNKNKERGSTNPIHHWVSNTYLSFRLNAEFANAIHEYCSRFTVSNNVTVRRLCEGKFMNVNTKAYFSTTYRLVFLICPKVCFSKVWFYVKAYLIIIIKKYTNIWWTTI